MINFWRLSNSRWLLHPTDLKNYKTRYNSVCFIYINLKLAGLVAESN